MQLRFVQKTASESLVPQARHQAPWRYVCPAGSPRGCRCSVRLAVLGLAWALLVTALQTDATASDTASPLAAGDPAPVLAFTDIEGVTGHTNDYADRIVVYSFANRESSEWLTAWQQRAGVELRRRYPDLKVAFVGFADVSSVPKMLRGVVEPILRRINRSSVRDMNELYAEAGIEPRQDVQTFHLIPDWDGTYRKMFGLTHAEQWHVWLARDGRIAAALSGGDEDGGPAYLAAMAELVAASAATAATAPATGPATAAAAP